MVNKYIVAAILLLAGPVYAAQTGPLLVWTFDDIEGKVVKDSSGNDLHGKIIGPEDAMAIVDGRYGGKAMKFNTTKTKKGGAVILGGFQKHDLSKGLTLEAWIRVEDLKSPRNCQRGEIMATGVDRSPGFAFSLWYGAVRIMSKVEAKKTTICGSAQSNRNLHMMDVGVWYHVAATYDGDRYRVYINGEQVADRSGQKFTQPNAHLSVGAFHSGYAYRFPGSIDEIRIYTYPRTGLQIAKAARLR